MNIGPSGCPTAIRGGPGNDPGGEPFPEPPTFDAECRAKGNAWLAKPENAGKTNGFPSRYWRPFEPELESGFQSRCGYWGMLIQSGTVDHFFSKALPAIRHLVFEWSNYRYTEASVSAMKKNHDDRVLDPFEIEVDIPSMQLVCTARIPQHL
jgi:hypothetical protein